LRKDIAWEAILGIKTTGFRIIPSCTSTCTQYPAVADTPVESKVLVAALA
jgi:hypothetical protein